MKRKNKILIQGDEVCAECGKPFYISCYRKNYIFKDIDYNYIKNKCKYRVYFCSDSCMRKWRAKNK